MLTAKAALQICLLLTGSAITTLLLPAGALRHLKKKEDAQAETDMKSLRLFQSVGIECTEKMIVFVTNELPEVFTEMTIIIITPVGKIKFMGL